MFEQNFGRHVLNNVKYINAKMCRLTVFKFKHNLLNIFLKADSISIERNQYKFNISEELFEGATLKQEIRRSLFQKT